MADTDTEPTAPRTMTSEQASGEHDLHDAENDAEAARLRSIGFTYREIAQRVDCSPSTAHRRVQRALVYVPSESVKELREIESRRLDDMWKIAWNEATQPRHLVQAGKVVRDKDGSPVVDHGAKLHAIVALVRIQERRAKLHGLDAPTRVQADLTVTTETVLDQDIRRLIDEMAEAPTAVDAAG